VKIAPLSQPIAGASEAHDDDEAAPRLDFTPRKLIAFGVFVVLALVALYLLLPRLAGLNETWHRIEKGDPAWLVLAFLCSIGMFAGYVVLFQGIYGRRTGHLTWRESYQITMASLAATRLFSAGGAGGLVLTAWALRRAGMRRQEVADTTVSFLVLTYLVYTVSLIACGYGLYFGLLPGPGTFSITFIPATLALIVTIVGLSIAFVPPDLQERLERWCAGGHTRVRRLAMRAARVPATVSSGVRDALRHLVSRDPALLGAVLFWGFQIACLWASFRAFGHAPPLAVVIMAFFIGMLGNLLPLPGGIGGVDGGMIGAFAAFGVDAGLAVVAVLAYRAFTFWLPTLPGIIAYIQLRRTVERWKVERRTAPAAA
jgi:uncharacterized protein (TIRG00374 family)